MHSTNVLEDGYLGSGRLLARSITKHGTSNHVRDVLEFCSSREDLKLRESSVVSRDLLADPKCMNLTVGGEGGPTRLGAQHSEEAKERIRQSLLGHLHSESTKAKIGEKSKGRLKGKSLSEEHKRKVSEGLTGIPSQFKGVPRSNETRARISEALKQRFKLHPRSKSPEIKPSPEVTRGKLADAAKRQWADPIKRQRMLEARRRRKEPPQLVIYCDDARHLVCIPYSVSNLHYAARSLGIGRHFFHRNASYPHYDIPKRRVAEIRAKCIVVTSRDILKIVKGLGLPEASSQ